VRLRRTATPRTMQGKRLILTWKASPLCISRKKKINKMAISYSGIVNYGKLTLPSVEIWNTNSNIEKNPTRSLMTRKKTRVGDTSLITSTIDSDFSRICDSINYYPRGQNPMVEVSYGQGQNSSTQSFLPYRIIKDGAFRPPLFKQENLLPLSRMPRLTTNVQPNSNPTFYKKIQCEYDKKTKEKKLLNTPSNSNKRIPFTDLNYRDSNAQKITFPFHHIEKKNYETNRIFNSGKQIIDNAKNTFPFKMKKNINIQSNISLKQIHHRDSNAQKITFPFKIKKNINIQSNISSKQIHHRDSNAQKITFPFRHIEKKNYETNRIFNSGKQIIDNAKNTFPFKMKKNINMQSNISSKQIQPINQDVSIPKLEPTVYGVKEPSCYIRKNNNIPEFSVNLIPTFRPKDQFINHPSIPSFQR
jgi:hypothetical protein